MRGDRRERFSWTGLVEVETLRGWFSETREVGGLRSRFRRGVKDAVGACRNFGSDYPCWKKFDGLETGYCAHVSSPCRWCLVDFS